MVLLFAAIFDAETSDDGDGVDPGHDMSGVAADSGVGRMFQTKRRLAYSYLTLLFSS